jgi:DNA-binding LacI/PurR family transcriptional regulator
MAEHSDSRESDSRPSLVDVAKLAGVSRMTVSRVLNRAGGVKEETTLKVEAALETLGYRRNPMVQALMSQVRRRHVRVESNIAWLEEKVSGASRARIAILRDIAQQRAQELGFGFEVIFHKPGELSAARMDSIFKARGVQGAVIAPIMTAGASFEFPWEQYAVATIGRSLLNPLMSYVMMHFQHGIEYALQELKARGYRRIGFLTCKNTDSRSDHIQLMSILHHNYQIAEEDRVEPLWMDAATVDDFNTWYARYQPDVIIDSWLQGWELVQQLGVRIPEDLGFLTLSHRDEFPEVSGLRVPIEAMGAGVVDIVVAQIQRNERGLPKNPKCMLTVGTWLEGSTLRSNTTQG